MAETILLGNSTATEVLRREIATAAGSNAKVMILGETGAGKEVVARSIHEQSRRAGRPFIAVNCSGIPETLLESELFGHVRGSFTGAFRDKPGLIRQAHRGTLFLDELGEMSLRMQAMLLRFAETGEATPIGADAPAPPADVRLITATNRDLPVQIQNGAFRQDLYYRLNAIQIRVLPLRDRSDDVDVLLRHYLDQAAAMHGTVAPQLTPDAEAILADYSWPGNVRELKNVAERLALADWRRPVGVDDLPFEIRMHREPLHAAASAAGVATARVDEALGRGSESVARLFERFAAGEDFWTVVYQPFRARELTRQDLIDLIDAGLQATSGSYRQLLPVFNLPQTEYKRFHAFLYQQKCNLPVSRYRARGRHNTPRTVASGPFRAYAS